jgi:type IV pilus assembly protein PilA
MRRQAGFSVIEVLVVAAIMCILGLIAVPQYSAYRQRAYNLAAESDLKSVAQAQERFFEENASYKAIENCFNVDSEGRCAVDGLPGLKSLSKGVSVSVSTSQTGFVATAKHIKGTKTCTWDSTRGGLVGCS